MRLSTLLSWFANPRRSKHNRRRFQPAIDFLEDRTVFAVDILVVSGLPAVVTAGVPITFTVTAQTPAGLTDASYPGTVAITAPGDARATLPLSSTLTQGQGTFSITLLTAGLQAIVATDDGNSLITGQANRQVIAATTSQFLVSGLTAPVNAGTAGSVTVTAADQYGNPTTGYAGVVHFSSSDVQAVLPADQHLTTGTGTFNVTLKTAGTQSLIVTDTVNTSITGRLGDIPQTAPVYTQTPNPAGGGVKSAWYAPGGQGLDGDQYVWDSFTLTANATINEIHWRGFYAYASYHSANIPSAPVSDFTISIYPTSAYTGVNEPNIFVRPLVQYSAGGNAGETPAGAVGGMPMYDYAFTLPTGFQAVAGTKYWMQIEASQGVAPSTSWPPDWNIAYGTIAGGDNSYFLEIIGGTLAGGNMYRTVTGNDTAFSLVTYTNAPGVVVNPAAMSRFNVAGFPPAATAGMAGNITVTASDPYGNVIPNYAGTVHFTSSDPKAVLPADTTLTAGTGTFTATLETAGTQSLTATDTTNNAWHGAQSGIAVSPANAYSMTMTGFPSAVTVGTTHGMTITLWDRYGNVATGYTGTVTFSSTDAQAALPADYTFAAADRGAWNCSATLNTLTTPNTPWSLTAHDTQTSSLAVNQPNIQVYPPITFGALSFGEWTATRAGYSATIAVTGGAGGYAGLNVTGLPAGLRAGLSGSTITIGGTPTTAGTFTFTVALVDSAAIGASQTFTISVEPSTTLAWTGLGGDNHWTNPANWTGAAPTAGSILDFGPGALQKANVNDFPAGTGFKSILFEDSGYTLGGNAIGLSGGISEANAVTGSDIVALNIALNAKQTLNVGPNGVLQMQGVISGASGVTKAGGGLLVYAGSAANTYTGMTTVNAGTVQLNNSTGNALAGPLTVGAAALVSYGGYDNQIGDSAVVTVAGGTFNLNGHNDKVGGLVLGGGTVTTGAGTLGTLFLGGNITSNAASTPAMISGYLDLAGGTRTVTVAHGSASEDLIIDAIIGNGGLTKAGPGALELSGSNTYVGLMTVNAGVLDVRNAAALGTSVGGTTVAAGATLEMESDNGVNFSDPLKLAGGTLLMLGGTNTWSDSITVTATSTINVPAGTLSLSGIVGGSGGVNKVGAGTLIYNGSAANTCTGRTTVSAGLVQLNSAGTAIAGPLTVGAGATVRYGHPGQISNTVNNTLITIPVTVGAGGLFDLNGQNDAVGALVLNGGRVSTGNGILSLEGTITSNAAAVAAGITGNVNLGSATRTVYVPAAGQLVIDASISGAGGLMKTGAGTLLVNNTGNTFIGLTTVAAGTLGGTGKLGNVTVSAGGHLAPGAGGPGTLTTTGTVTFAQGSSFNVDINGTTAGTSYDQLVSSGTVTLGGATLNVSLGGFTPASGNTFTLIARTGAGLGNTTFAGLPERKTFNLGGKLFQISYVGGTSGHDVVLTVQ